MREGSEGEKIKTEADEKSWETLRVGERKGVGKCLERAAPVMMGEKRK